MCCCSKEDKKNYCGKRFQPVRNGDYYNLSSQQTSLEKNKVLNVWSIYFTPILGIDGRRKVICRCNKTVKRWETWTSIFMMGINKAHVLFSWRWDLICKDFVRLTRPRKCEVILGVNFFSIKPFLKEQSFFWVADFLMVGQLDHKILVLLSLLRSLLNLNK